MTDSTAVLNELREQHWDRAVGVARKILGDDSAAEEAVDSAFVRVAQRLAEGYEAPDWGRFFGLIAHSMAVDEYRRRRREVPVGLGVDVEAVLVSMGLVRDGLHSAVPLSQMESMFPEEFDTAVRDVEDDDRDAFILTELRGLTQVESADVLGVSQPTVSRRVRAARTYIQDELVA